MEKRHTLWLPLIKGKGQKKKKNSIFTLLTSRITSEKLSSSSFEEYPIQVRHKQNWDRGFIFYYPRLLYCLNQMLAMVLLSQHRVSSSKTVRPRVPCVTRCIGHAVRTWSAVCSEAPHSQFGEGARPHLCMDEWNRSTQMGTRSFLERLKLLKNYFDRLSKMPR